MEKPSLRSIHKGMKQRSKAAQDARQEFYDTVNWSDVFLLSMMFIFSILGNIYPPQQRRDLIIGLVSFVSCFFIYLCIKAHEPPKKRPKRRAEKAGQARKEEPKQDEKKDAKEEK
ncbi:Hypothetical protein SCF082_LOCUS35811 [Durusdinium trenchii]|uniref:Uncharacterized protein n=1 Tax=Durusdinium trenchii TaxID=1381693 RepID=A0ABP0PD57_9DINO